MPGVRLTPLAWADLLAIVASPCDALPGSPNIREVESLLKDVAASTLDLYGRTGTSAPWVSYLGQDADGSVVGTCSFVGLPADDRVEIAYFTFPGYEGAGRASAMAEGLVRIARERGIRPFAHTSPEANASTRILEKLGFVRTGVSHDDEIGEAWRWSLN